MRTRRASVPARITTRVAPAALVAAGFVLLLLTVAVSAASTPGAAPAGGAVQSRVAPAAPGDILWTRLTPHSAWDDKPGQCALGPGGSVYVVGTKALSATKNALTVAKYTGAGTQAWRRTYAGPSGSKSGASGAFLTVDPAGNVVVGGTVIRPRHHYDFLVAKYSPQGARRWLTIYDTPFHSFDRICGIATDKDGDVYAAGSAEVVSLTPSTSYLLVKLGAATGTPRWYLRWRYRHGNSMRENGVTALAVTSGGTTYLTGWSMYSVPARADVGAAATVKVSPAGKLLWVRRNTGTGTWCSASDVVVAPGGGCYVCGSAGDPLDAMLIAYTAGGASQVSSLDFSGQPTYASALALDPSGNIDVCGSTGVGYDSAAVVAEFTPAGAVAWSHDIAIDASDFGDIAVDTAGNVYASGTEVMDWNLCTARYGDTGGLVWAKLWNGTADPSAEGVSVCASTTAVFATGLVESAGTRYDGVLISYEP
jgi:hypothetical protein